MSEMVLHDRDAILTLLYGVLLGFLVRHLSSYMSRKGANLATKEDTSEITRRIEEVRTEYTQKVEDLQQQNRLILESVRHENQLRMAALDKRLEVHQKAYTLWCEVNGVLRDRGPLNEKLIECQDWFAENNLYLQGEARQKFHWMLNRSSTYCDRWNQLKHASPEERQFHRSFLEEAWEDVRSFGKIIEQSLGLPHLEDDEQVEERKDPPAL